MSALPAPLPGSGPVRAVAFVARCSGAAMIAFMLARGLGLEHPIWATVSALIVSQERLGDTHRSLLWRLVGTAIGIAATLLGWTVLGSLGADRAVILGLVVALCAAITRVRPDLRVCMWTSAIVVLTGGSGEPIWHTALARGGEVLLGGGVGAVLHVLADQVVLRPRGASAASPGHPPEGPLSAKENTDA